MRNPFKVHNSLLAVAQLTFMKAHKELVAHSLENDWDVEASGSTAAGRGDLLGKKLRRTPRFSNANRYHSYGARQCYIGKNTFSCTCAHGSLMSSWIIR